MQDQYFLCGKISGSSTQVRHPEFRIDQFSRDRQKTKGSSFQLRQRIAKDIRPKTTRFEIGFLRILPRISVVTKLPESELHWIS